MYKTRKEIIEKNKQLYRSLAYYQKVYNEALKEIGHLKRELYNKKEFSDMAVSEAVNSRKS